MSPEQRLAFIRKAQVWMPTNVPEMDIKQGPEGKGAFQFNEAVTCDYVQVKLSGASPKFECRLPNGDVVKVKYGRENGEVQGEVLTTRLLWALGFGADRMYPVRIMCRGCPPDPLHDPEKIDGLSSFDPADIERKFGKEIESRGKSGWVWPELVQVDPEHGASIAQRDALKLLAVFVQHTDNKAQQQRLVCLPDGVTEDGDCTKPFLMLNDVGLTFGRANVYNRNGPGAANFDEWTSVPVWRDKTGCTGHLSESYTGSLKDPEITEAGRQFLADLLVQLTDRQLHDLFEVARVELRSRQPGTDKAPASIDDWVAAFKQKREEIVNRRCS